jgi:hypothetical protein
MSRRVFTAETPRAQRKVFVVLSHSSREREYFLPTHFEKESHILLAPRHENCPLSTDLGGEGKGEGGCIFTGKTQKVAFSVIPANPGSGPGQAPESSILKVLRTSVLPPL